MYAVTIVNELAAEAAAPTSNPYAELARLSFHTRREVMEAARVINPADVFGTVHSQHATVVASAQTRHPVNVR